MLIGFFGVGKALLAGRNAELFEGSFGARRFALVGCRHESVGSRHEAVGLPMPQEGEHPPRPRVKPCPGLDAVGSAGSVVFGVISSTLSASASPLRSRLRARAPSSPSALARRRPAERSRARRRLRTTGQPPQGPPSLPWHRCPTLRWPRGRLVFAPKTSRHPGGTGGRGGTLAMQRLQP